MRTVPTSTINRRIRSATYVSVAFALAAAFLTLGPVEAGASSQHARAQSRGVTCPPGSVGVSGSGASPINAPPFGGVGMAGTNSCDGYWIANAVGVVTVVGSAPALGSLDGMHLNAPVVGIASDPKGRGYWLVASDGGVFAFGASGYFGSIESASLRISIARSESFIRLAYIVSATTFFVPADRAASI